MKTVLTIAALAWIAVASAFEPKFVGYCGNSGTAEEPVVFGAFARGDAHRQQTQAGPVYDADTGLLYASAGAERINAYTVDGRMVATYPIPKGYFWCTGDPLVRVGDNLVFRRNKRLWTLPLNATNGTAAVAAACDLAKIRLISSNAQDGELAVLLEDGSLHLWHAAKGTARRIGELQGVDVSRIVAMDWNAKGALFAFTGDTVYKIVDGKILSGGGFPKKVINRGVRMMSVRRSGGAFHATSYSGSMLRLNEETLDLDPGVVFGGSGGHTLSYIYFDHDIGIGGGITHLKGDYFAVMGGLGPITVIKWNAKTRQFARVRRIGALTERRAVNLSKDGDILVGNIGWKWNDREDAPTHTSRTVNGEATARVGNEVLAVGLWANMPAIEIGAFEEVGKRPSIRQRGFAKFSDALVGAAVVGKSRLYTLDRDGACRTYRFGYDAHRMWIDGETNVVLKLTKSGKAFSGMTQMNDEAFVIACDGEIVLAKPNGEVVQEVSRFGEEFAPTCRIAADANYVLVSEKEKNRVTVLTAKGDVVHRFDVTAPGAVAINGDRLVIHDTAAQRILKYEFQK